MSTVSLKFQKKVDVSLNAANGRAVSVFKVRDGNQELKRFQIVQKKDDSSACSIVCKIITSSKGGNTNISSNTSSTHLGLEFRAAQFFEMLLKSQKWLSAIFKWQEVQYLLKAKNFQLNECGEADMTHYC